MNFTRKRKAPTGNGATKVGAARKPFCYVTQTGSTVRSGVLDSYVLKEKQAETSQQIRPDRFANKYSNLNLIQPLYHPEQLAFAPEVNAYHARCCQVKARDTAGIGWDIVALVTDPHESDKEAIEDFFNNQKVPLVTTLYRHQYDIEVCGFGGIEVVRAGYQPTGMPVVFTHVPGHTLRIHKDDNKFAQKRGTKTRWFKRMGYDKDVDKETGNEAELGALPPDRRASEILWNAIYTQRSDYYGVPDIVPALGAIHGDLARRDYNIAFFDNFGVPAYAVFITGDFDPGDPDPDSGKTALEEGIENHFQELANNPHSVMVLTVPSREGGNADVKIQFVPLANDVKDASFRLYRKDNRDEVISAHGLPPYRLGIAEAGSLAGNMAEESTEIYKNSVVNPRQEVLEALINQHIIWDEFGFNTKEWGFKFREIDTKDEAHDMEQMVKLFEMGAATPRDLIQAFGARFGIEDDPNDPLLDMRFVNGTPIQGDAAAAAGQEATEIMKSLQEKLMKVAMKYVDAGGNADGNGHRDRTALALVNSAKELGGMDRSS